ncbi:hypothetical protein [Magnetospirillum sp. UT-4]|nr:hypothetical protein [Magnetospirillum sp. UT-4]
MPGMPSAMTSYSVTPPKSSITMARVCPVLTRSSTLITAGWSRDRNSSNS